MKIERFGKRIIVGVLVAVLALAVVLAGCQKATPAPGSRSADATVFTNVDIGGTLAVTGATTLTGATALTGVTAADGGLTVGGGFGSSGCTASTAGALSCNGAAIVGGSLLVTGTSTFQGAMNVNANGDFDSLSTAGTFDGTTIVNTGINPITINDVSISQSSLGRFTRG